MTIDKVLDAKLRVDIEKYIYTTGKQFFELLINGLKIVIQHGKIFEVHMEDYVVFNSGRGKILEKFRTITV